jgi:hypothetical protein
MTRIRKIRSFKHQPIPTAVSLTNYWDLRRSWWARSPTCPYNSLEAKKSKNHFAQATRRGLDYRERDYNPGVAFARSSFPHCFSSLFVSALSYRTIFGRIWPARQSPGWLPPAAGYC